MGRYPLPSAGRLVPVYVVVEFKLALAIESTYLTFCYDGQSTSLITYILEILGRFEYLFN